VDYLLMSYLCFAYGLPVPHIAAGANLDLPVLGPFLRQVRRGVTDSLWAPPAAGDHSV
jgi:glycerol-3-phosphate O-acyltransferase